MFFKKIFPALPAILPLLCARSAPVSKPRVPERSEGTRGKLFKTPSPEGTTEARHLGFSLFCHPFGVLIRERGNHGVLRCAQSPVATRCRRFAAWKTTQPIKLKIPLFLAKQ
jgi:hypothetical protein